MPTNTHLLSPASLLLLLLTTTTTNALALPSLLLTRDIPTTSNGMLMGTSQPDMFPNNDDPANDKHLPAGAIVGAIVGFVLLLALALLLLKYYFSSRRSSTSASMPVHVHGRPEYNVAWVGSREGDKRRAGFEDVNLEGRRDSAFRLPWCTRANGARAGSVETEREGGWEKKLPVLGARVASPEGGLAPPPPPYKG